MIGILLILFLLMAYEACLSYKRMQANILYHMYKEGLDWLKRVEDISW